MSAAYYDKLKFVQSKTVGYLRRIFQAYGNELQLKMEDYNLLSHRNNCLETSTAIGFVMEEFISSQLAICSRNNDSVSDIVIKKLENRSTVNTSYDCYCKYDGVFFMINIKVEKNGSHNNAVSAINILHKDYVETDKEVEKAYMILKVFYDFGISKRDEQRKIMINDIDSFFMEEIDFSRGHKQDNRNWSENFNKASGRLLIPVTFRTKNKLDEKEISYAKTRDFLHKIFMNED